MNGKQTHEKHQLTRRRLMFGKFKLKAVSRTSAVLSGFAMITMVEISLDEHQYSDKSHPLLILYAVVTCLLVGVHLLALMISKCVLSQLEAATLFGRHEQTKLDSYIEVAWILSTGVGIFLFLLELIIVCWVKFYFVTQQAAIATSVILVPVIIFFWIFALHFYRRLTTFKLNHHQNELDQLESRFAVAKLSQVNVV